MGVLVEIPTRVRATFNKEEAYDFISDFIEMERRYQGQNHSKDTMRRAYLAFLSTKFQKPVVQGMNEGVPTYYVKCENDTDAVLLKLAQF